MSKEQIRDKLSRTETPDINSNDVDMAMDAPIGETAAQKRRAQQDWLNYLNQRDYVDAQDNIHDATTGAFKSVDMTNDENNTYYNDLIDSAEGGGRSEMGLLSLARAAAEAHGRGDKTVLSDIEDEIQDKLISTAERYGWDNDTTMARLDRLNGIIYGEAGNEGAITDRNTNLDGSTPEPIINSPDADDSSRPEDGPESPDDNEQDDRERLDEIRARLIEHMNDEFEDALIEHEQTREDFLKIMARSQKGHLRRIRPGGFVEDFLRNKIGNLGGRQLANFLTKPTAKEAVAGDAYAVALDKIDTAMCDFMNHERDNGNMSLEELRAERVLFFTREDYRNVSDIAEMQRESTGKPMSKFMRRVAKFIPGFGLAARFMANKKNANLKTNDLTNRQQSRMGEEVVYVYAVDGVAAHKQKDFMKRLTQLGDREVDATDIVNQQYDNTADEVGKNRNRLIAPAVVTLGAIALGLAIKNGIGNDLPMADFDRTPNTNSNDPPMADFDRTPNTNSNDLPMADFDRTPNTNSNDLPMADFDRTPNTNSNDLPMADFDRTPNTDTIPGTTPNPPAPEPDYSQYEYPWNWGVAEVGEADSMNWLKSLAEKARQAGHDVVLHRAGDGIPTNDWYSVDGVSDTQRVIEIFNQYR